ncbi:Uncharacterised protein [Streptococcus pneumoniae]|nr:Uncharacterised protein [Streptococcus pneumoniae]COF80651.1 Uncharacterised protein [Streptococcus pneumoniae]
MYALISSVLIFKLESFAFTNSSIALISFFWNASIITFTCFSFENLYAPNLYAPNNNAAIAAKPMIKNKFFLLFTGFVSLCNSVYEAAVLSTITSTLLPHSGQKFKWSATFFLHVPQNFNVLSSYFLANFIPANAATYVTIKLNKVKYINEFCIDNTVPLVPNKPVTVPETLIWNLEIIFITIIIIV